MFRYFQRRYIDERKMYGIITQDICDFSTSSLFGVNEFTNESNFPVQLFQSPPKALMRPFISGTF